MKASIILILMLPLFSKCQDPNPYGKYNQGNAKIEKKKIFGDQNFFPEQSAILDSTIFVFGDNGYDLDETFIFQVEGNNLTELDKLKHTDIRILSKNGELSFLATTLNPDPKNLNRASWQIEKESYGTISKGQISYKTLANNWGANIFYNSGILVATQRDKNEGNWENLMISRDTGLTWTKIIYFHHFNDFNPYLLHNNVLYVYASNKGFRDEDHSIYKFDLQTQKVEETPITDFKGKFPEFIIFNDVPVLITRSDAAGRIYIYDLLSDKKSDPEVLTIPKNRYVSEVYRHKDVTILITTPEEEAHSNERYKIYSKQEGQKGWVLDFTCPHFEAESFYNGLLVGFDINHNLIRLQYK